MLISIILLTTLLTKSNSQSQIPCQFGAISDEITTDRGPYVISSVLCSDDDMMYIDIQYLSYADNWFGIVFSYDMAGYALCYTTGQNTNSDPSRAVALYQYSTTSADAPSATYNPSDDWIKVSETTNGNTIRVVYKQELSTLPYDIASTTSIPISYAWGEGVGLVLGDHDANGGKSKNPSILTFTTVTRPPTEVPTSNPTQPQPTAHPIPGTGSPTTAIPTGIPTTSAPTQTPTTSMPTQSPIQICASGAVDGSLNVANKLQVTATLCSTDDMIYIDILYASYNDNYFGIVFDSDNMYGDALIYTTGKSGDDVLDEGLYAYNMKEASSRANGVVYTPNNNWTQVFTEKTNDGLHVVYKQALSETPWNLSTESIKIGYAIGYSLVLNTHTERNDANAAYTLSFTQDTTDTGSKGCEKQDLVETTATLDEFTVTLYINCDANTVAVTIAYSEYNNNWFSIVFNDKMVGNALIYTTGKSDESTRDAGLYPYTNEGYTANKVSYDGTESDWTKISETTENGVLIVHYQQDLDKTEIFSSETEEVYFKWAKGENSLVLSQHLGDASGRAEKSQKMNLLTGETTIVKDDLTLEITHGVLMWLAWALFASIGIFSSAFRHLYPDGPTWFYVHQWIHTAVIGLTIIGFMIALVFTERNGKPHFNNTHTIIGLIVIILCVLQPINAALRSSPPKNGWPKGVKPLKRVVWEYIHKGSGYVAWILGCVAAMLGMLLIGEKILAYVHMFLWCSLLLIIYIILFVVKIMNAKKESEIETVKKEKITSDGHESEDPMLDTNTHKPR